MVYCLYQQWSLTMQNYFSFSALSGMQARQATFVLNIPLSMVDKLFSKEDVTLPADKRSQRIINQSRVNQISNYIVENPNTYVLPPLVAYVRHGVIQFIANKEHPNLGELRISMDASIALFDGQHRASAIADALNKRKFLESETITVYILPNSGIASAQQVFADINMNAVKPAQSIKLLYNQRDQVTAFTKSLIQEFTLFSKFTDLERTNLPSTSESLFTFSGLYQANQILWKGLGDQSSKPIIISKFWECLIPTIKEWAELSEGITNSQMLRETSLIAHSITWAALAEAGLYIIQKYPKDYEWIDQLNKLNVNWNRNNPQWKDRAISGGKICKTRKNIILMSNVIIKSLGLQLNNVKSEYELPFTQVASPTGQVA